jgi:hypothetical protein
LKPPGTRVRNADGGPVDNGVVGKELDWPAVSSSVVAALDALLHQLVAAGIQRTERLECCDRTNGVDVRVGAASAVGDSDQGVASGVDEIARSGVTAVY